MRIMIFFVTAFLFISTPVSAEGTVTCNELHLLANTVMEARQSGVDPLELHAAVDRSDMSTTGKDGAHTMIRLAFKVKAYNSPIAQQHAIEEFADSWLRDCLAIQNR